MGDPDPYYSYNKERGACVAATSGPTKGQWSWHCPWEEVMATSNFCCNAVQYDCSTVDELLTFYGGYAPPKPLPEGSPEFLAYTVSCIKAQCRGGTLLKVPEASLSKVAGNPAATICDEDANVVQQVRRLEIV